MPHAVYEGTVPYPAEIVFGFVADAENNSRWHQHVHETHWIDPPPIRLGRRARQTGRLFGREWAFVAEVVTFDPPRSIAYQVIKGYPVRTAIEVVPMDASSSRLILNVTTPRLPGPLDGLVSRLLRRSTERRGRADIQRLSAALRDGSPVRVASRGQSSRV